MSLYRGDAHNDRNLNYQIPDHIPIVFHNFTAEKKEKYITFNIKIIIKLKGVTNKDGK